MFGCLTSLRPKLTRKRSQYPGVDGVDGVDPTISDLNNITTEQPKLIESMSASRQMKQLSVYNTGRRDAVLVAQKQEAAIRERVQGSAEEFPQYRFLELIGKGTYGRVYKCHDLANKQLVAVKVLDTDTADYTAPVRGKDESLDSTLYECQVLYQLTQGNAKNINRTLESFSLHSQIWIVSEYCPGGSIHTLLRAAPQFTLQEKYIKTIARELAEGLKSIHELGIIHRDVKAANVMIHEQGNLQIIDFGVSGILATKTDKRSTMIGTLHWMSPEFHFRTGRLSYGTEMDVWSYGCTLYECATGHPPDHDKPRPDGIEMMKKPPRLDPESFSAELCEFVAFVLQPRPSDRPTMAEVCKHPYIANTERTSPAGQLSDMVETFKKWEAAGGQRMSLYNAGGAAAVEPVGLPFQDYHFSVINGDEDEIEAANATALASSAVNLPTFTHHLSGLPAPDHINDHAMEDLSSSPPQTEHRYEAEDTDDLATTSTQLSEAHPAAKASAVAAGVALFEDLHRRTFQPTPNVYDFDFAEGLLGPELNMATNIPTTSSVPQISAVNPRRRQDPVRGEARSLQAVFKPPTSDLPLRSGNDTTTHSQELQYDAGVGPSIASVPTVKLSNVTHAKANAHKRKTMEWTFPTATTAKPSELQLPPRPQLRHAETAPVGDMYEGGGTLDLDAMWGDDGEVATAKPSVLAGGAPDGPAIHHRSDTLDLDALMGVGHEKEEEDETLAAPAAEPKGKGKGKEASPGSDSEHGFNPRPLILRSRPPRALSSFRRGDQPPPMPSFPAEALRDDCSPEALTAHLQDMVAGFADTLGALAMELEDDDDEDE